MKSNWGNNQKMPIPAFMNAHGHNRQVHLGHHSADGQNSSNNAMLCKRYMQQYNNWLSVWNGLADKSTSNPDAVNAHTQLVIAANYLAQNHCAYVKVPQFSQAKMAFTGIDPTTTSNFNAKIAWDDSIFVGGYSNVNAFGDVATPAFYVNTGCNCGDPSNCKCKNGSSLPAANAPTTPAIIEAPKRKNFFQWLLDGMK